MVATVATVAYLGLEARAVEVQVQLSAGLPHFIIVGLPDKAVKESGERVRAALAASGLSLPPKRIIVNLAPADLPKEGSHYDLPIALALMAVIGAFPADALDGYVALGELGLDALKRHCRYAGDHRPMPQALGPSLAKRMAENKNVKRTNYGLLTTPLATLVNLIRR